MKTVMIQFWRLFVHILVNTYNLFVFRIYRRMKPQYAFEFEGISGAVERSFVEAVTKLQTNGAFAAVLIGTTSRPFIVTSDVPDLTNPIHVSVLWHEVGHIRCGHLPILLNRFLANGAVGAYPDLEFEADDFSAANCGAGAMALGLADISMKVSEPAVVEFLELRANRLLSNGGHV